MIQLTNEIIASREWRVSELEKLKKIGLVELSTCDNKTKEEYFRMCVPYIYAHWEGFVVESFKQVIGYINSLKLDIEEVRYELYTFSLQDVLKPLAGKQSFEQSQKFVERFVNNYREPLYIAPALLSTKSNLNYDQICVILRKFGMVNSLGKYKIDINQLVNQRNRIAHGENGIIIDFDNVSRKISVLQEVFDILILEIDRYINNKMYLRN
ncbi:MAG: hypothetical protein LUH14_05735 [Clostridiaceae bacterium]|nr:hypothetical protein [Clostridiaceae bacterium]